MRLLEGGLVLSPSDLVGFMLCRHLTGLDLAVARGERCRPEREDPEVDLLRRRGLDHEQRFLARLESEGRAVVRIPRPEPGPDRLAQAEALTIEAMRAGADIVYQPTFFDGRWAGTADFLFRTDDEPSALGPFSYEPADAKLARRVRPTVLLQLCAYAEQVARVQGTPPKQVHVLLGDGGMKRFPTSSFAAYFRASRSRLEAALGQGLGPTYPEPVEHCDVCPWTEVCEERRREDDHLSLVADMRRDQAARLVAAGIGTVEALGTVRPLGCVEGISTAVLQRLADQARLQVDQRRTGTVGYDLLPPAGSDRGLAVLPAPSPGDLFLDLEGDPFVAPGGLEYLFGLAELTDGAPAYRAIWAHDAAEEKRAFEAVIDLIGERLARRPDLHVYHYGAYEATALKRLMGVHGTREQELDRILRGQVLVDLHRVVRQGVRVSQESYSLKMLEPLYRAPRTTRVAGGLGSIVAYEEWLETGDPRRLEEVAEYNRDDCTSLAGLRGWLEARRGEAEARFGALPRPVGSDPAPSEAQQQAEEAADRLVARLTGGLPTEAAGRTPEQQAQWLLAQLVGWHRREAKPEWWAYFGRRRMTEEELFDDTEAIAGLRYEGVAARSPRAQVHRYWFDPAQEHKLGEGDEPHDPSTGRKAGTVVFIDNTRGLLHLKRGARSDAPHPRCLIPAGPVPTNEQREAIARVGQWVSDHGIDAPGPYRAARDLLLRRPPRREDSYQAIQGPPGSGKTHTGARLVLSLTAAGHRVGITANSHKAISVLLLAVSREAQREGRGLRILQKAPEGGQCSDAMVECTEDNAVVEAAVASGGVDVVAGTAWLFARPGLDGALHTLIVEEAGQFSLANVVAMAAAARNLVLLGDPRQLAQPSKAAHPPGAERSALEHLLGEHATMPAELGLFLPVTRRLHPDVCRFVSEAFYERRLEPHASCALQAVGGAAPLAGAGLRWVPVEHTGNRTASREEAEAVTRLFDELLGRPWTDAKGAVRPLVLEDLLVVAPYNAQVARLAAALPPGARIGTVDKFQGQQAPVVLYSMAASSPEDVPRGMEFLYSLNRLNVAVSRAEGLAILLCGPALLRPHCRSVEQMRLANALCRFVEMAVRCEP